MSYQFAMHLGSCSSVTGVDCDVVVSINDAIGPLESRLSVLEEAPTQFEKYVWR